jgi:hypothetical protein
MIKVLVSVWGEFRRYTIIVFLLKDQDYTITIVYTKQKKNRETYNRLKLSQDVFSLIHQEPLNLWGLLLRVTFHASPHSNSAAEGDH